MRARPVEIRCLAAAPRTIEEALVQRSCRICFAFEIAQADRRFAVGDRHLLCRGEIVFEQLLRRRGALVIAVKAVGDPLRFRRHRLACIGKHGLGLSNCRMQRSKIAG